MEAYKQHGTGPISLKSFSLWFLVLLFLFSVWLYSPDYSDSFVGDDFVQQWRIRKLIEDPIQAYKIFNPIWTDWYYRPIQNLWILGNRLLFDVNPYGYYYLQIGWHLLAISLLYRLSRKLKVNIPGALTTAVLFAVSSQHLLTVSWISSIGNVISASTALVATLAFTSYLEDRNNNRYLFITWVFLLISLLAHELAFFLPFLLLGLWWVSVRQEKSERIEIKGVVVLFGIAIAFALIQIFRPNANVHISSSYFVNLEKVIRPSEIAGFLSSLSVRWLAMGELMQSRNLVNFISNNLLLQIAVVMAILVMIVIWFMRGNTAIRFGLIWAALQLYFLFLVLWVQRPDLLDGRHLYSAWAGLSLALGASLQFALDFQIPNIRYRWLWKRRHPVILFVVPLFLIFQIRELQITQETISNLTRLVKQSEVQMKTILPEVNDETRVFSSRFILSPEYFAPAAAVWYGRSEIIGGSLDVLKKYSRATNQFFVFDHDDGSLYNLMPELQRFRETYLLWRTPPKSVQLLSGDQSVDLDESNIGLDQIIGPKDDRRIAIGLSGQESGWISFSYQLTVPKGGQLAFSIAGIDGQVFRVRILPTASKEPKVVFAQSFEATTDGYWFDALLPLELYEGQDIELYFELNSGSSGQSMQGYWGNPRIVVN
jgi:hypothetical protein